MKNKFFSTFIIIIFIVIFLIFYKGLQNSNIYTPNTNVNKNVPIFEAKLFDSSQIIKSKIIFIFLMFGLHGVFHARMSIHF